MSAPTSSNLVFSRYPPHGMLTGQQPHSGGPRSSGGQAVVHPPLPGHVNQASPPAAPHLASGAASAGPAGMRQHQAAPINHPNKPSGLPGVGDALHASTMVEGHQRASGNDPMQHSGPPTSGSPLVFLTPAERAQIEARKLEREKEMLERSYAWYKQHVPGFSATKEQWQDLSFRQSFSVNLWTKLQPAQQKAWKEMAEHHAALRDAQKGRLECPVVSAQHAMYSQFKQPELMHLHHHVADTMRQKAITLLGESHYLPGKPSPDLPIFPNVYDHEDPLRVIMPSLQLKGKSFFVVGGGLVGLYITALILGAGGEVHLMRKYESYIDEDKTREPYGNFLRHSLLAAPWPALLRFAEVSREDLKGKTSELASVPRQYFMDILFYQAFLIGRASNNWSSQEKREHGYRVSEHFMADIIIRQYGVTSPRVLAANQRLHLYSGSTRHDVDTLMDRRKQIRAAPAFSSWIIADGQYGLVSRDLSKVVLPTTSLRVGLNFDTPKKSIDGVKLGLLWPDLQKLARISPVPNTAGSEFVITSAKTLDVGLKEDGFKALFALLRWDWPEFYDPEKLFDICASKITGEDHMSRVTSDAQQALRECFSRILQVHKGLLLCTTTAHNFQVSVRHGATKRADIPQRPPLPATHERPVVFFLGDSAYPTQLLHHFKAANELSETHLLKEEISHHGETGLDTYNSLINTLKENMSRVHQQPVTVASKRRLAKSVKAVMQYSDLVTFIEAVKTSVDQPIDLKSSFKNLKYLAEQKRENLKLNQKSLDTARSILEHCDEQDQPSWKAGPFACIDEDKSAKASGATTTQTRK